MAIEETAIVPNSETNTTLRRSMLNPIPILRARNIELNEHVFCYSQVKRVIFFRSLFETHKSCKAEFYEMLLIIHEVMIMLAYTLAVIY